MLPLKTPRFPPKCYKQKIVTLVGLRLETGGIRAVAGKRFASVGNGSSPSRFWIREHSPRRHAERPHESQRQGCPRPACLKSARQAGPQRHTHPKQHEPFAPRLSKHVLTVCRSMLALRQSDPWVPPSRCPYLPKAELRLTSLRRDWLSSISPLVSIDATFDQSPSHPAFVCASAHIDPLVHHQMIHSLHVRQTDLAHPSHILTVTGASRNEPTNNQQLHRISSFSFKRI